MSLDLFVNKRMFKILVLICFCSFILAEESAECNCDVLQINSEDEPNKYYNFTKQWDKEEGKYFYFSIEHHLTWGQRGGNESTLIKDERYQGPFSCQNGKQKLSLKFPWPVNESKVLESQCLKDSKCSEAIEDAKGRISIYYFS